MLKSPGISFYRSLKVLEFTKSNWAPGRVYGGGGGRRPPPGHRQKNVKKVLGEAILST